MEFHIFGRLTKDPEARQTTNGKEEARFTIAEDRKGAKEKTTDFFNIVAWGKRAEYINKHLRKGNRLLVEGVVQNNNYEDKNGNKVFGFSFIANEITDFFDWNQDTITDSTEDDSEYYPADAEDGIPF